MRNANHADRQLQVIEDRDIEEAINAAAKTGDNAMQKQSQGYGVRFLYPRYTAQRMKWTNRRPRFLRHLQWTVVEKLLHQYLYFRYFDQDASERAFFCFSLQSPTNLISSPAIPIITNVVLIPTSRNLQQPSTIQTYLTPTWCSLPWTPWVPFNADKEEFRHHPKRTRPLSHTTDRQRLPHVYQ